MTTQNTGTSLVGSLTGAFVSSRLGMKTTIRRGSNVRVLIFQDEGASAYCTYLDPSIGTERWNEDLLALQDYLASHSDSITDLIVPVEVNLFQPKLGDIDQAYFGMEWGEPPRAGLTPTGTPGIPSIIEHAFIDRPIVSSEVIDVLAGQYRDGTEVSHVFVLRDTSVSMVGQSPLAYGVDFVNLIPIMAWLSGQCPNAALVPYDYMSERWLLVLRGVLELYYPRPG